VNQAEQIKSSFDSPIELMEKKSAYEFLKHKINPIYLLHASYESSNG